MKPVHIATEHTADFVMACVPRRAALLEIGAGNGEVAAELLARGYRVTAVEPDAAAVQLARERGVTVVAAQWPCIEGEMFDAILFSRSLHHIHDLDGAVAAARRVLHAEGVLLVEDFAYEVTDEVTVGWLAGRLRDAAARGILRDPDNLASAAQSLEAWCASHDRHLHTAAAIEQAIRSRFGRPSVTTAPYLYRYLARCVPDDLWVRQQFGAEEQAGGRGEIHLIGRRFVKGPEA